MRKLEKELHNIAVEESYGREIINFAKDSDANMYRFFVDMLYTNGTPIKTYLYVPGELPEPDACRVVLALMVDYMRGGDIDGTLQALVSEAQGKSEVKEVKEEEKPKKTRKRRTTTATKEKVSDEKPESKEEEKEDKPKEKPKAKSKTIPYDRSQTEHKKELAKILNSNFPGWAINKELAVKAKDVSEQLQGVALFDSKGEVLSTFAENVMELMGNGSDEQVDL